MRNPEVERAQFTTLVGVLSLIIMAVFAAEVTIMQLYSDLFATISVFQRAFLDASTLVLFIALPLWFFIFSPTFRDKIQVDGGYSSVAFSLYIKVLAGLYLIQLVIMLFLPEIMAHIPLKFENLIDGALTAFFATPLFAWLLYRLEIHYRLEPLADFLNAPITLYVLLLFMIFLADLLQEIIFPLLNLNLIEIQYELLDSLVTVAFIAPLLLILIVRPLRRMAESKEARINAVYDQVVDAIVKIDHDGIIESFNLAAQNIFGFQSEEMIGRPASLLLDCGQIDLAAVLQQLSNGEPGVHLDFSELTSKCQDGGSLTLNVSISKISLDGPTEFLLLLRDISQNKATEAALLATDAIFREIFNQTEDAIIFFEPGSGEILDVNITAETLYGFTKAELRDAGARAFCDEEAYRRFLGLIADINENGNAQIDRLVNYKKDGRSIIVSLRGKMMSLQGAKVIYSSARDITNRTKLENEAREIQSKLIHANKMTSLGLLVSGVAHEINNPNNLVLSNAQLLAKIWRDSQIVLQQYFRENGEFVLGGIPFSELDEHIPELFSGITDGSQRINAIVGDLKRFVRQDDTQYSNDVDLNAVAVSAVSMLHYELAKYTDNFQSTLSPELPMVKGSGRQLGQVIVNLLMNACQALPDKSCAVLLETSFDPQEQIVKVSVHDHGSGLPEGLKEKILEPFFTTKMDSGGTGLGLSISKSIVKDHGGQLDFFSQPETGTTFTVTLPVSDS